MTVLRFQKNATVTSAELSKLLPAGSLSSISIPSPGEMLDITVTPAGVSDCTEVMAVKGYTLIATDPVPTLASVASSAVPPVEYIKLADGTVLSFGALANGEAVIRSGATLIGGTAGSTFDIRDVTVWDHFISSNIDTDEFGSAGWRISITGTGAIGALNPEVGHPGTIQLDAGTSASGRSSIYLGESAAIGNWVLLGAQNAITFEWLVKLVGAASISSTNLERFTAGFGDEFDAAGGIEHQNGVYIEFEPALSANWRLRTAAAGVRSVSTGTTPVVADAWYRVSVVITYPGGSPSAQMHINGVAQGSAVTLNIPTIVTGFGIRIDSAAGAVSSAIARADYALVTQVTAKET